jgi:hypothetical protein
VLLSNFAQDDGVLIFEDRSRVLGMRGWGVGVKLTHYRMAGHHADALCGGEIGQADADAVDAAVGAGKDLKAQAVFFYDFTR